MFVFSELKFKNIALKLTRACLTFLVFFIKLIAISLIIQMVENVIFGPSSKLFTNSQRALVFIWLSGIFDRKKIKDNNHSDPFKHRNRKFIYEGIDF